jgi:enterochelin esterase family protein
MLAISLAGTTQPVQAQFPLSTTPPAPWINSGGLPPIKEAEVLPDKRVTFRLEAPKATEVTVSVGTEHADIHKYSMTKGGDGIWSATIDRPVPTGIYPYHFELAGATVHPGNFEVKGPESAVYDVQDVPHGAYSIQNYHSQAWNKTRTLGVYVPAEYFSAPNRRFPVMYYYDNPMNYIGGMRYREVLDNLIAQKKAVPMIFVVMEEDASSGKDAEGDRMKNSTEFAQEIMPLVDQRYRTMADRDHRAMAGISHNGGASWTTAIHNLDKLSYLGLLSSGMFGGLLPRTTGPYPFALYAPWEPDKVLPDATKAMLVPGHQLHLFYLACGEIDPRVNPTRTAAEQFKKYGVNPVFESYAGGHQPKAFRPAFISYASKVFK